MSATLASKSGQYSCRQPVKLIVAEQDREQFANYSTHNVSNPNSIASNGATDNGSSFL